MWRNSSRMKTLSQRLKRKKLLWLACRKRIPIQKMTITKISFRSYRRKKTEKSYVATLLELAVSKKISITKEESSKRKKKTALLCPWKTTSKPWTPPIPPLLKSKSPQFPTKRHPKGVFLWKKLLQKTKKIVYFRLLFPYYLCYNLSKGILIMKSILVQNQSRGGVHHLDDLSNGLVFGSFIKTTYLCTRQSRSHWLQGHKELTEW